MPLRRPQASRAPAPSSLSLNPCHHLKPGGLRLRRAVSKTVTCARMQRSWSAPDTARPLGPGDSQGPTCPLDGCALSSEAGNTPATPGQSPRPSGWLRPPLLSSLGLRGHQRGSAAYGQEGGLACGVPSSPWSGEAVLFLKTSLSVCLAQNVSGALG